MFPVAGEHKHAKECRLSVCRMGACGVWLNPDTQFGTMVYALCPW